MRRDLITLERMRPAAAGLLLAVFLGAAQLAPATHLATHRNDHTHGPAVQSGGRAAAHDAEAAHAAAHRAGHAHEHPPAPAAAEALADHPAAVEHGPGDGGADHHDHAPAPTSPGDHGRASSAHFGLALLEGPPPPFLRVPTATLARPLDTTVPWRPAPPPPLPSVRGPPRLI